MNIKRENNFFDINEISHRIKVQKPYFAFQKLWQEEDLLIGNFISEQPLVHEAGLITAGELGRHLAILGSCTAVALSNGPEAYYLATKANFIRKPENQITHDEMFYASARVISIDKRTLKISAQAWNKEPIAELICEYAIVSPALFERSFKHYASDNFPAPPTSPYQHPISLHNLVFNGEKLDACAGPLLPQQCAGHFFGYPCWPVAIISQTAFQVTGELLRKKYCKDAHFYVRNTQLSAKNLISANTILRFNIEITTEKLPLIESVIRVYRDDEEIAQLISLLELLISS